jgi:hypothetical protein
MINFKEYYLRGFFQGSAKKRITEFYDAVEFWFLALKMKRIGQRIAAGRSVPASGRQPRRRFARGGFSA